MENIPSIRPYLYLKGKTLRINNTIEKNYTLYSSIQIPENYAIPTLTNNFVPNEYIVLVSENAVHLMFLLVYTDNTPSQFHTSQIDLTKVLKGNLNPNREPLNQIEVSVYVTHKIDPIATTLLQVLRAGTTIIIYDDADED